jgi:hypothetical protein
MLPICLLACLGAEAEAVTNLCSNPGAEQVDADGRPRGWQGTSELKVDRAEARSGRHSLKLSLDRAGNLGWTSAPIPVTPGSQFALGVWAKLDGVVGGNGACMWLYHLDATGKRIGASARLSLGGEGDTVCTRPWRHYGATSTLTPDVKAVSVHLRLYKAKGTFWFDDVSLNVRGEINRPRPLRQGLRLAGNGIAICTADGADELARSVQGALKAKGVKAPIVDHCQVDLHSENATSSYSAI